MTYGEQPPIQSTDIPQAGPIEVIEEATIERTTVVEVENVEELLAELAPAFKAVEAHVRVYWHDPRYCTQFMLGFLQLLQEPDAVIKIQTMTVEDVPIVTDLS